MTTFETIFLVLLIIVVLLQIVILVSGAVSRHSISEIGQLKTMLDDSEKRICDEIEDLQKAESLQFSDVKVSVSHLQGNVGQLPRPVKGSGLAKGTYPIQFQGFAAQSSGPSVAPPEGSAPRIRFRMRPQVHETMAASPGH